MSLNTQKNLVNKIVNKYFLLMINFSDKIGQQNVMMRLASTVHIQTTQHAKYSRKILDQLSFYMIAMIPTNGD